MTLRTIVFAVLAAAMLVAFATSLTAPSAGTYREERRKLYRRGGDTFMRMYYLSRAGGWEEGGQVFLARSRYYYQKSARADPSDVETVASLALVVALMGAGREGTTMLFALATQQPVGPERTALYAANALAYNTRPQQRSVDRARDFLMRVVPGRMILARAYERMGEQDLADAEWRAAEAEGLSLLRRLEVMLVVCGAMVAVGLIGLLAAIVGRFRRRARPLATEDGRPPVALWGMREAVEALILWLFVATAASAVLAAAWPAGASREIVRNLLPGLIGGVAATGWVLLVAPGGRRLGWRAARWWRSVAVGVAAAGIAAPAVLALYTLLQDLQERHLYLRPRNLPVELPEEHPLVPLFATDQGWQARVILIVGACVVIPILEETVFRGILYRALRRQWSFAPAALASAAVFALVHLSWVGLAPYLLLGVVFAFLYERSGSLLAPWAAHGAFNGFNLVILLTLYG
jgi:membrane protease YdiL (CAAX protease family)